MAADTEPAGPACDASAVLAAYRRACERRRAWEGLWQDCYDHALPAFAGPGGDAGPRRYDHLFEATAADGVEQLASSLLAQLTPPWSRWLGLAPGVELDSVERDRLAPLLEKAAAVIQDQLERSGFAVALHQAFLELVTAGTACLQVEAAPAGASAALAIRAVPLSEVVLAEGPDGRLDIVYRQRSLTLAELVERFPAAALPGELWRRGTDDPQQRFAVVEAVQPAETLPRTGGAAATAGGYAYSAVLTGAELGLAPIVLAEGSFAQAPLIAFRWVKAPGEAYGRSPVMKALPDIKTANKTVELILKNASMAVTGVWQADDDGVLNPANVELSPGAVIPKAVGSQGLQPLAAPGRFDVSQVVLDDLRARIRHALLLDRFAALTESKPMTATEAAQRSAELTRLLGATYGRLQAELLTPLAERVVGVLAQAGELPPLALDGRRVALDWRSPLARAQAQRDAVPTLTWLESVAALGPAAAAQIDSARLVRWLADAFGVPAELLHETPVQPAGDEPLDLAALAERLAGLAPGGGHGG